MLAHNLLHYLLFPSHYTRYVEELITTSYLFRLLAESALLVVLFVAALLAFAALAVAVARWRGLTGAVARQAGGFLLLGLLAAYAVNYAATNPGPVPGHDLLAGLVPVLAGAGPVRDRPSCGCCGRDGPGA